MKRQDYFPIRIGDQIVWLGNFKAKLPGHATALDLVPASVTAILLDVDNALYALDDYRGALGLANTSCYQCIEDALYDPTVPGTITWAGFTPPAGAPASVAHGCLKRVFNYISGVIKKAPGYTLNIGEDLGTEGAVEADPSTTVVPKFGLRLTVGAKLEIGSTKGRFDGIKIEIDRGTLGTLADMDLRPNYTLNWLPGPGESAIVKVRLRYLFKGEEYGLWSEWQTFTLTGS